MSSVFFYEPFYDVDRLFEQAFNLPAGNNHRNRELAHRGEVDGAVRSLKPRYVIFLHTIFPHEPISFLRMDLHEDKEKNLVTATFEFPGVTKENISIDVHNGRLTVSAETKQSSEHDENGYAVRERRFGKYSRTLQLPQGVKVTKSHISTSLMNADKRIRMRKSRPPWTMGF